MKTLKRYIMSEIFVTFSKGDCMFAQGIFFSWSYEGCGWVLVSSAVLPFSYINEEASFAHTHFFYYVSRTYLLRIYNHIPIDTWLCPIFCEIIHSHSLHSSYILLSPLITKQISFRSDTLYWYNCMSSCCCWEQDLHLGWVSEAVNLKAKITPCCVSQIQNQVIWGRSCLCHDFHTVTAKWPSSFPKLSWRACVLQTEEELLELHESKCLGCEHVKDFQHLWRKFYFFHRGVVRRVCGCVTGNLDGGSRFLPKRVTNIKVAPGKIRKKPQINIFLMLAECNFLGK